VRTFISKEGQGMKIRARNYLATFVLLAACGLGISGLLTPVAEDVAQAAAPYSKSVNFGVPSRVGQSREVRRESIPPFDNGRVPITSPASPFKPLIASPLGGPVFGTNYRANTDTQSPNLAQQEPSIAVNPTNPLNMVVAAKDERQGTNTKHVYIYSSTDGGVTWINQRFPYRVTVPPSSSDPVVNFSDDGICYVTALIVGGGSTAGVQVARSTDGGITFSTGAQAVANGGADKEWTWIDNFPSSPYYHRMYVAWRNFGGGAAITLNYSTDRGATWSPEVAVSESGYQFPMPVVLPNGDVIVTYLLSFGTLGYARSTDGGVSFAAAQKVAFITDPQCPPDNSGCGIWRMNPIPATAVNPNNGDMVITWADGRDATATIYYARSTDNGSTWSAASALAASGVPNTYQVEPWVEADEQGIFHSIWYDDRENPDTSIFNIYYSRSTDSGQTWSAATRISTATSDLRIGIPASYNLAAGDYINVTASHGNVYAAWTDTRSGTGEDIYVVRGTYSGGTPSPTPTPCVPTASWNTVSSPNISPNSNYLRAVSVAGPNDVWAVGYASGGTGPAQSIIMHWQGQNWKTIAHPSAGTSSNWLYGVHAVAPNDVWAVGAFRNSAQPAYDETLILHWNGTDWSIVPSPNPGTWNNELYAVSAAGPNEVWAVGEYDPSPSADDNTKTLTMRWNGTAWATVASPNGNEASYNSLRGVKAIVVDAENVWAVGYYGVTDGSQTLTLHWNGGAWSIVSSANGPGRFNQLLSVDATNPNDIWAVGYNNPDPGGAGNYIHTLVTHWDGTSWSQVASPNPVTGASNYFDGVTAISANDAWAVGYHCTAATGPCNARTFTAHWDGSQWTEVASPNNDATFHQLHGVDASSTNDVWAVGYYGTASPGYQTLTQRYHGEPCITPSPTATRTATRTVTATATRTVTLTPPPATFTATRTSTPVQTAGVTNTTVPQPSTTGTPVQPTGTAVATTSTPTVCSLQFSDVPTNNTFYANIRCLACRGIITGYSDGTFRPNNDITRGQISKIVSQSAGFSEPAGTRIYEDVPEASPFFTWIQRLSHRGLVGGYPCGLIPEEPCIAPGNRPYFRPNASATRGQLSKIVASARGINTNPTGETYQDVPTTHTFYVWIEQLSNLGVMGGYPCGTVPSEPCGTSGKPYFRPNNNVTRGQASKIVANTFFPGCITPFRSR
jgi:hypothetical protein